MRCHPTARLEAAVPAATANNGHPDLPTIPQINVVPRGAVNCVCRPHRSPTAANKPLDNWYVRRLIFRPHLLPLSIKNMSLIAIAKGWGNRPFWFKFSTFMFLVCQWLCGNWRKCGQYVYWWSINSILRLSLYCEF